MSWAKRQYGTGGWNERQPCLRHSVCKVGAIGMRDKRTSADVCKVGTVGMTGTA